MKSKFLCGVAFVLLLAACATTRVLNVWKDAAFHGGPFSKVLVVGVIQEPAYRRVFESKMVRVLEAAGVGAHTGYSVFPNPGQIDRAAAIEKIQALGVDAVLVTRLLDKRKETVYTPGTTYVTGDPMYGRRGWYGYYGGSYSVMQTPGYTTEYSISTVETKAFDVDSEESVWVALTETQETTVTKAIDSYVKAIAEPLRTSGLF